MRLSPLVTASFALLATLAACGGSTSPGGGGGSGTVTGTVSGVSFTVASALAQIGADETSESCGGSSDGGEGNCTSSSTGQVVVVLLTNRSAATCSAAQADQAAGQNTSFANMDLLAVAVGVQSGTVAPGTYDVTQSTSATSGALAEFETTNASCGESLGLEATSGTVTISSISSTAVSGSYDVTFGSNGSFSGSFDVDVCALPDGGTASSGDAGKVCE